MKLKILADKNIPFLEGRLDSVADVIFLDQDGFTPETVRDTDALIIRTRTRCDERLLKGSRVSLIATATIGTDHIDRQWCAGQGIRVESAPGCNAPGVAQYVWSALIRLGFAPMKGDRLGVVGEGNIGGIVAHWGRQMGAEVWVSDPPRQRAGIPGDYHPLDEILSECKAVTFHTPLTRTGSDPTFHLLGKQGLDFMRPDSILVNAARGGVVDNTALLERIRQRPDIRTVIDTWEGEPKINLELLELVDYGTFHIAGYSRQGKERATRMVLDAVARHFNVDADRSGLEPPYLPSETRTPVPEGITASYDPMDDTEALRANPEAFDTLRNTYRYREEY